MTVAALPPSKEYVENGFTVAFAVPFRFKSPLHIAAQRIAASGAVTELVNGVDFTVTGGSTDSGGTLTVAVAAVLGTRLVIRRVTPRVQQMNYATSDTFPAESHESALDNQMLVAQEQDVQLGDVDTRALKVPIGEAAQTLPNAAARAGRFLVGGALGALLFSHGTGADLGLREDLADSVLGTLMIAYQRDADAEPASLFDRLKREVWAEDYGFAAANSGAENAAAFQLACDALPAGGGTVRVGQGSFTVDEFLFPDDPKVVNLQGSGDGTEFVMGTAAGPLIRRDENLVGRITGARIGGFRIRAHAASDKSNLAHVAVKLSGFGKSTFHDISYTANQPGTGVSGSVGVLFDFNGGDGLTYVNVVKRIQVAHTYGPSRVVRCQNGGNGFLYNPNLNEFRDSWVYGVAGCNVIADMLDSTRTRVSNVLFEDSAGAAGIGLGHNTVVTACWFELISTPIFTSAAASVDGSASVVYGNFFSGALTSFIDTIGQKPLWYGNAGGGQAATGQGVTRIGGATVNPAAPTLARTGGGTITGFALVAAANPISMDALGRVTFHLRYSGTPDAANGIEFGITPPAGFVIEQSVMGAIRGANGAAVRVSLTGNSDGGHHQLFFDGADAHEFNARVTIVKT